MIINPTLLFSTFLFSGLFITDTQAVDKVQPVKNSTIAIEDVTRNSDPVTYTKGQRLFMQNCARCHGKQGEGANNWQRPDEQGKNKAPPLNGTAHSWHHSPRALMNTIKNGTGKMGGNMPGWKDKLTEGEIKLILSWIFAQWPDEIYTAWYNRFHQDK